ncbi:PREDICTED: uncharacterized protein LOC109477016 [Branchiostoma belcheri]|uniref:Uncharacterized protein LOC109477016 n=1 Tax=Branchiostoma belcheri TaxID=7741 RepID=A0A6P4ZVE4_BRABE|nr:PREDICTED: uncharacterized protein LOC109477016 [Branchiostoma belcheri]
MYSTDAVPFTDDPRPQRNARSWILVPHKEMFVRIEEDLVEDERRSLKGLLYGRIPAGKLQKYGVGDIFRHMERMGQISASNLEPLAELMELIHRKDWAIKIRTLQEQTRALANQRATSATPTAVRAAPRRSAQPFGGSRQRYHTDGPGANFGPGGRKRTRDVAVSAGTSTAPDAAGRHSSSRSATRARAPDSDEESSESSDGHEPEEPPVKRRAPANPITDAHLARLAKTMPPGWMTVGLDRFGATTADIDRWETKYPRDRDMQIVEMFKSWKDKTGKGATLRTLCDKLEKAGVPYDVYKFLTEDSSN